MAKEDFEGVDFGDYTPTDKIMEFTGVGALAKSYEELRTDNSKKIRIPGETATDDEKTAFNATLREQLGTTPPETADGYTWKAPEGMEEQFKGSAEDMAKFHAAGFDDATVSLIMQGQADSLSAVTAAMQENQTQMEKDSKAALEEKWGDDYAENMKGVNAMDKRFPGLIEALSSAGLANNQAVLEAMHDISISVREDRPPSNDPKAIQGMADELKTLKADKSYMNGNDPKHEKTMLRIRELQRQMPKT